MNVLHELRHFHGEMFAVVHVARTTLLLLPTLGDPCHGNALWVIVPIFGQRCHDRCEVLPAHARPKLIDPSIERECPFLSRHRDRLLPLFGT